MVVYIADSINMKVPTGILKHCKNVIAFNKKINDLSITDLFLRQVGSLLCFVEYAVNESDVFDEIMS